MLKRRPRTRILAAFIAIVAMLLAQLAVAMHGCVMLSLATVEPITVEPSVMTSHADCIDAVEKPARSALCKTHCEADEQSHATANVEMPEFVAPFVVRLQIDLSSTGVGNIETTSPVDSPPLKRNRILRI